MRAAGEYVSVMKAFCDVNRIQIMRELQSGEKCACHLLEKLEIGQSTLSHHMKILLDSGVVVGRKDGRWMHYQLSTQGFIAAHSLLTELSKTDDGNSVLCK